MKVTKINGRRDFVKKSASAAVGGTLLGLLPHPLHSGSRPDSVVLKIGLVGCGSRGSGAVYEALNASTQVEVVGIGDTFGDKVEQLHRRLAKDFPKQCKLTANSKFTGFDAYKKVIELCDVVLLATPPPFRPTHFEAAVAAGKHTFLEKPLAVDVPGYLKVIETGKLADKKKLTVAVGLQFRYSQAVQEMVARIHQGEL